MLVFSISSVSIEASQSQAVSRAGITSAKVSLQTYKGKLFLSFLAQTAQQLGMIKSLICSLFLNYLLK